MAYYRSSSSLPPVVKNLIVANAVIYVAQLFFRYAQGIELENYFALWTVDSGNFKIWQLITHLFMHDPSSPFHLIFNMFGLYMFGRDLESVWGPKRFLQFYMLCGLAAGLAHLALIHGYVQAIGASGAVMGLLAGYAYLFPNTQFYLLFPPMPIKAKWLVAIYIAIDLFGSIAPQEGDRTAHWAHLGGALAGFIIVIFWNRKNRKKFY